MYNYVSTMAITRDTEEKVFKNFPLLAEAETQKATSWLEWSLVTVYLSLFCYHFLLGYVC